MSTIETIKLNIDEKAYSYAKIYASLLNDEYQRKRAYASIVALFAFLNKLEQTPYNVQKAMTLFRNPILNEQYEITDVYVNNWHLDVRVIIDGNAFLVPKLHFEEDVLPDYYVVVKVDKELKNAELVGIYNPNDNKDEPFDYNYRSVPLSCLMTYDEFLNRINSLKTESYSADDKVFFNENYLGIMDNDIDNSTKNKLVKLLFNNSELRTEFCCFTGFEMVSSNSSKYDDLFNDNMLGIVGANDVDLPKYEGKEEQIYIGNDVEEDNISEIKKEEEPEETVADILDELFGADEETIEPDTTTEKPVETIVEQTDNMIEENNNDILPDNILDDEDTLNSFQDSDLEFLDDNTAENQLVEENDEIIEFIDEEDTQENVIRPMGAVDYIEDVTASEESSDDIQKVIVDYDETGEPIYSYITNVDNNESDLYTDIDAEIEEEPLDVTESLIEEIPEDNIEEETSEIEELTNIENISDDNNSDDYISIIEDVNNVENNNDTQDFEEFEEIKEIEEDNKEQSIDSSEYEYFDEENLADNIPAQKIEENIAENIENIAEEYSEIDNMTEEKNADSVLEFEENNEETLTSSTEEENHEEKDEDIFDEAGIESEENEPEGEEGGEYENVELETPEEDLNNNGSKSRLVAGIVGGIVALGLIGGGAALYLNHSKAANQTANVPIQENNQQDNMFEQSNDNEGFAPQEGDNRDFFGGESEIPNEENNAENQGNPDEQFAEENQNPPEDNQQQNNDGVAPLTENDLIVQNNNPEGDVNKAMVNTFAQGNSGVSLMGINWFCATELFTDKTFKNYLQNLDNTLKQNLKNNFMNATENPSNNSVEAKFAVNNNGNLEKVIISNSSGSNEIDNLVLRSIKETFEGEKSQILDNSALKSDMYYLKVVIKL